MKGRDASERASIFCYGNWDMAAAPGLYIADAGGANLTGSAAAGCRTAG